MPGWKRALRDSWLSDPCFIAPAPRPVGPALTPASPGSRPATAWGTQSPPLVGGGRVVRVVRRRLGVTAALDGARAHDLRPPEPLDLLLLDHLRGEEARRHRVELLAVLADELARALLRLEDERLHLAVHLERGLLGVGARLERLQPRKLGPCSSPSATGPSAALIP